MPKFKEYQKVLVRDTEDGIWAVDLFSHYIDDEFVTLGNRLWAYCIPYHGNEDLVGTAKSAWKPKKGELVAFSDDKKVWYIGFFSKKLREGKLRYVGYRASDGSYVSQYQYCEPAKKHFDIFMSGEK